MSDLILDSLLVWAHFLALFFTFAFLLTELVLCRSPAPWRLLARVDVGYFISAILVLATGFGRVFYGAKGPHYYFHNTYFYALLITFTCIGLVSVWPTMVFIRSKKAAVAGMENSHLSRQLMWVRRCVLLELALFCVAPFFAVQMTLGLGN